MSWRDRLQPFVANAIADGDARMITGVIGDAPSSYSRTPLLWNALYLDLGWDARSFAWDVPSSALASFVTAARTVESLAGFNVTNPHKVAVLTLLDELDERARRAGAVNTIVRRPDGRLAGTNTDGHGALAALTADLPGERAPFMTSLDGKRVLLIGAGGAARAIAAALTTHIRGGWLGIANRGAAAAAEIARSIGRVETTVETGDEAAIVEWMPSAELVINASSKGQRGWRVLADDRAYTLEPYSALAPCVPEPLAPGRWRRRGAEAEWRALNADDIARNRQASAQLAARLPPGAGCFDIVYAPEETAFLVDARASGHATRNGRWMIIGQAAAAFAYAIGARELQARGLAADEAYARAMRVMAAAWQAGAAPL